MAPRRSYRSVKVDNNNVNTNLVLNDVLCPICRSILIEPVTIPCSHGFCLSCFEGTVANANLTCPLCRVRFSSWHRLAKKDNKIVNVNLWEAIKSTFPQQVENKLNGIEENLTEDQPITIASPGQIRKEYEEERQKELHAIRIKHETEAKASEDLIKKIVEEETVEKNKLRSDEQFARKLQKEINSADPISHSKSKETDLPRKQGPLDKFLHNSKNSSVCIKSFSKGELSKSKDVTKKEYETRVLCQDNKLSKQVKNTHANGIVLKNGTKNNVKKSLTEKNMKLSVEDVNEVKYFKPIDIKNIPLSEIVPIVKVPAKVTKAATTNIAAPTGKTNFIHDRLLSAFARVKIMSPILGVSRKQQNAIPKYRQRRKRRHSSNISNTENIDEVDSNKIDESSTSKLSKLNLNTVSKEPCVRRSNRILSMDKASDRTATVHHIERSPNTRSKQRIINKIVEESLNEVNTASKSRMESPPCHGFEPVEKSKLDCGVRTHNNNISVEDEELLQRKLQEANDLELARKLQEEFNKGRYSTRSSIIHTDKFCKKHKQVKLDEIIKCRNKVK